MSDIGKVIELAARRAPVAYTIRITHHWDGQAEVFVEDVADDERSRGAVAHVLKLAADTYAHHSAVPSETTTKQDLTAYLISESYGLPAEDGVWVDRDGASVPLNACIRAFDEITRLYRCISMAMGCIDPESINRGEALAWYRLYDAEMGREPRDGLGGA